MINFPSQTILCNQCQRKFSEQASNSMSSSVQTLSTIAVMKYPCNAHEQNKQKRVKAQEKQYVATCVLRHCQQAAFEVAERLIFCCLFCMQSIDTLPVLFKLQGYVSTLTHRMRESNNRWKEEADKKQPHEHALPRWDNSSAGLNHVYKHSSLKFSRKVNTLCVNIVVLMMHSIIMMIRSDKFITSSHWLLLSVCLLKYYTFV